MYVEIKQYGGWKKYTIKGEHVLKDAAYRAIRRSFTILSDKNHTWRWTPATMDGECAYIRIMTNYESPQYIDGGWMPPFMTWFTVEYRRYKKPPSVKTRAEIESKGVL